jgi:hypothetical protein
MFTKPKKQICTQCGNVDVPKRKPKGSTGIELLLWLCFIIPGLLYSFWRLSSYHMTCKVCGGTTLIPVHSPLGKKKLQELENNK